METYEIIAKGRVQGVGFRMFAYNLANKLKISGFVSNSIQNSNIVEIHAQGDDSSILTFLSKLKNGPQLSRVESISKRKLEHTAYNGFIIK